MKKIMKLTLAITLSMGTMSTVYGDTCYTNLKDGCNKDSEIILVKEKDTSFGFCTEYIDQNNQREIRCHSVLSEEEQQIAAAKKAAKRNAIMLNNSSNNKSYQTAGNKNSNDGGYNTGYNNSYNYSYNYNYGYGMSYDHYHSHHDWEPPQQEQRVTLPSRPVNGGPTMNRSSASPSRARARR